MGDIKLEINKLSVYEDHTQAVYALEADVDEQYLYSAGADRMLIERDLNEPENRKVIANASAAVYCLKLINEKNMMMIGQRDGVLHFLDMQNKSLIKSLKISAKEIFAVHYLHAIDTLIVGTGEGKVFSIGLSDFAVKGMKELTDKSARCIAFNPLSNEIALGYSDNFIRIFDSGLQLMHAIEAHKFSVFSLAYSEDGLLYSGSRDAHLKVWDPSFSYQQISSIIPHLFTINDICFYPGINIFATASRDKSIRIWDAADLSLLRTIDKEKLDGHAHSVNKLKWIASKNILVSAGDDRKIMLWKFNPEFFRD